MRRLWSSGIRGRLILLVVAVQIGVPLVALSSTRASPTRFGFQMYSGLGWTIIEAADATGRPIAVDVDAQLAGLLRPEFDWTRSDLPERLCATVHAAETITLRQPSRERTVTC